MYQLDLSLNISSQRLADDQLWFQELGWYAHTELTLYVGIKLCEPVRVNPLGRGKVSDRQANSSEPHKRETS